MGRIVIAGGTGYVGSALAPRLVAAGHDVVVLTRGTPGVVDGVRHLRWDGETLGPWAEELDGADAVVHLAGKRVDARPTGRNVEALITSRVRSVAVVGQAIAEASTPPPVWVQLATLAIHGEGGERTIHDDSVVDGLGPRQMTTVALAWEHAVHVATTRVARTVVLRAGIAFGGDADPATRRLRQLVRLGAGGAVAGGRAWVSWLAQEDLLRIIERALDDPAMTGTYNATAPAPVTNHEMMRTFRRLLGRRVGLPSPAWLTRIGAWLLGSDPALALTGRRAVPTRLLAEGFRFEVERFEDAAAVALAAR